ncbi:hypothetical protein Tco_0151926 [Tanacetum coccineum]
MSRRTLGGALVYSIFQTLSLDVKRSNATLKGVGKQVCNDDRAMTVPDLVELTMLLHESVSGHTPKKVKG